MVQKHSKLLSWDGLEAVMMVGHYGTVRAAAAKLDIAHTTLAKRIAVAEAAMGVPAFVKTPRGYRATEDGRRMIEHAERMAEEVGSLERYLEGADGALSGEVKVSLNASLLTYVAYNAVNILRSKHPDIVLSFSTGDKLADIREREADIVLRMQKTPDDDLFGRRLCEVHSAVYVHKTWAEQIKSEMLSIPVVGWANEAAVLAVYKNLGVSNAKIIAHASDINAQAAMAQSTPVATELPCYVGDQNKNLVRLVPHKTRLINDVWLLTHESLKGSKRIRAALDAFAECIMDNRDLIEGNI